MDQLIYIVFDEDVVVGCYFSHERAHNRMIDYAKANGYNDEAESKADHYDLTHSQNFPIYTKGFKRLHTETHQVQ